MFGDSPASIRHKTATLFAFGFPSCARLHQTAINPSNQQQDWHKRSAKKTEALGLKIPVLAQRTASPVSTFASPPCRAPFWLVDRHCRESTLSSALGVFPLCFALSRYTIGVSGFLKQQYNWAETAMAKIPGDRLVLGLISVLRTLVLELDRRGVINADEFVSLVQQTAIAHRETGDPNNLADAIHAISDHLHSSKG